jgi:hypothetical protein
MSTEFLCVRQYSREPSRAFAAIVAELAKSAKLHPIFLPAIQLSSLATDWSALANLRSSRFSFVISDDLNALALSSHNSLSILSRPEDHNILREVMRGYIERLSTLVLNLSPTETLLLARNDNMLESPSTLKIPSWLQQIEFS